MKALVRGVAASFPRAISSRGVPISLDAARQQHAGYVAALRRLLGADAVTELPPSEAHPDCVFVEDAAVVRGGAAVVCSIGAGPRRGEEAAVADALRRLGYALSHVTAPATLDGGDVLQLPGSSDTVLVGLSGRTNAAGLDQLRAALPTARVVGVPVEHGLHLKSAVTALDAGTLVYADDDAGRSLRRALEGHAELGAVRQHVMVEPGGAANLLLVGGPPATAVVMQSGFPDSRRVLAPLCEARGLQLVEVAFSEFAKADGSLSCASILLPHPQPSPRGGL